MNAACFERIENALVAGDQAQTMPEWEQANRAFHRELVLPCKMPKLLSMIDDLQLANSRIIFSATRSTGWQPGSNHAHRQIFYAVKQREFTKAATLLQAHIRGLERASGS
jgi:DNA-binding GntR family transcriptional regulator